jgi:hypothetical protein
MEDYDAHHKNNSCIWNQILDYKKRGDVQFDLSFQLTLYVKLTIYMCI